MKEGCSGYIEVNSQSPFINNDVSRDSGHMKVNNWSPSMNNDGVVVVVI